MNVESRFERVRWPTRSTRSRWTCAAPVRDRSLGRSFALGRAGPARAGVPAPACARADVRRPPDAQDELVVTRENLQATVEELETSNEELQAANEEMLAPTRSCRAPTRSAERQRGAPHRQLSSRSASRSCSSCATTSTTSSSTRRWAWASSTRSCACGASRPAPRHVPLLPGDVGRPIDHFAPAIRAARSSPRRGAWWPTARRGGSPYDDDDGRTWGLTIRPCRGARRAAARVVLTFVDVTAERRVGRRLTAVVDSLPHLVAVVDREGAVTPSTPSGARASRAAAATRALLRGGELPDVCDRADDPTPALSRGLRDVLAGRAPSASSAVNAPARGGARVPGVRRALRDLGGAVISHST